MSDPLAPDYRECLAKQGSHPNHPVALLSPHRFFRTRKGSFMPFRRSFGALTLTCDPLLGDEPLGQALREFDRSRPNRAMVFAGVTGPTATELATLGYTVLKIGEEPWVDLADCLPKGNRGKGVRAARNQALRAGCTAAEWTREACLAQRGAVEGLYREWRGLTFISLEGGALATDPFADIPGRHYFAVEREGGLEAFLVATPVREGETYYLEDLVYRRHCTRGAQELAVLTALECLRLSGATRASLGLVLLRHLETGAASTLDMGTLPMRLLRRGIARLYNAEGQDLFRKRFQIARWEPTYLAFRGPRFLGGLRWGLCPLLAMAWSVLAMVLDLDPTLMWPWN
nr:phosphatidylglycerol lysyltransferase domain-containing protein [uncultured Holophaga sp.]